MSNQSQGLRHAGKARSLAATPLAQQRHKNAHSPFRLRRKPWTGIASLYPCLLPLTLTLFRLCPHCEWYCFISNIEETVVTLIFNTPPTDFHFFSEQTTVPWVSNESFPIPLSLWPTSLVSPPAVPRSNTKHCISAYNVVAGWGWLHMMIRHIYFILVAIGLC